jgi:hypothetical protein
LVDINFDENNFDYKLKMVLAHIHNLGRADIENLVGNAV